MDTYKVLGFGQICNFLESTLFRHYFYSEIPHFKYSLMSFDIYVHPNQHPNQGLEPLIHSRNFLILQANTDLLSVIIDCSRSVVRGGCVDQRAFTLSCLAASSHQPSRDGSIQLSVTIVCCLFLLNSIPLCGCITAGGLVSVLMFSSDSTGSCHLHITHAPTLILLTLKDTCLEKPWVKRHWVRSYLPASPVASFWAPVCMYGKRCTSASCCQLQTGCGCAACAPLGEEHIVCCTPWAVVG